MSNTSKLYLFATCLAILILVIGTVNHLNQPMTSVQMGVRGVLTALAGLVIAFCAYFAGYTDREQ